MLYRHHDVGMGVVGVGSCVQDCMGEMGEKTRGCIGRFILFFVGFAWVPVVECGASQLTLHVNDCIGPATYLALRQPPEWKDQGLVGNGNE